MTSLQSERKRVNEELPNELLKKLYYNSRNSINQLGKELGISSHTVSKYLSVYEKQYGLDYTISIDTRLLGFSEARIIAIKFGDKVPDIILLKKVLGGELFVQNAYMATGDFDLILHVIASNQVEFNYWLYKIRMNFCRYKPRIKIATLDYFIEGFLPVQNKLIEKTGNLKDCERKILLKLNENSRAKIKDIAKALNVSEMKVIYSIDKLIKKGIIKKFTTCIQKPEKRIFMFYGVSIILNEQHHSMFSVKFLNKILNMDKAEDITNDYSVVSETSGNFDFIYFCNFRDGESFNEIGPNFIKNTWASEFPELEQCILTTLIVGKWPFNKNGYVRLSKERDLEMKPSSIKVY